MTERTAELETIDVSDASDVVLAGRRTKAKLENFEDDDSAIEETVLVVHELASNIIKHAGEGSIVLAPRSTDNRSGIEVRAEDAGPGIDDIERAVADGYSTVGSLGGGLGTVHRLMDEVVIDSDGERGTRIVATRWSDRSTPEPSEPPLTVGAATRSKPGSEVNGDAFIIEHGQLETLVGVIDGLGHGQAANRAAVRARQYVRSHSDQSLPQLFDGADRVCRSSRSVVMALARFDWRTEEVTIGGVGNITVKFCTGAESRTIVTARGVIGANDPTPTVTEQEWDSEDVLVLHSDGLTSQWNWDAFTRLREVPVTRATRELLHSLATDDDDATVLMVRGTEQ